ncbi:MAG: hypothetical protein GX316_08265 [Firmicutes bacterium]|nr:hypothetical protein [Bacillota bacterium]
MKITIPLSERYLTIPRLVLGDVFVKAGLDVCEITSYKVALTEACRNLVHFAYSHLEPNALQLSFTKTPIKLTIEVSNRGKCFCKQRVKAHPALSKWSLSNDIDLLMITSLVDELRTGVRLIDDECVAFVVLSKYLGA